MSGSLKNREQGVRGNSIILDVKFYSYDGGNLVDPDTTPTFIILDPSGVQQASGSGSKISTGYYTATYAIPVAATLSDLWQIQWTAKINTVAVANASEYFEVITEGSVEFDHTAVISNYWLGLIKKAIAYPSVEEVILTDSEIKSYCIYPALRDYFTKFPILTTTEHALSSSAAVSIAFPDADTYAVIDTRVVGKEMISGSGTSFWDMAYYNTMGLSHLRGGSYGIPKYNPNFRKQAVYLQKMAISSLSNEATFDARIDEVARTVTVYYNGSGKLNITWAKSSENFESVRFVYKNDVVKLAQGYLKKHISEIAGLLHTNIEITMDVETLRTDADRMMTEVYEKWTSIPDSVVLRAT